MITILAPGQGSQSPRMLAPWIRHDRARKHLHQWSQDSGVDLIELGTRAGADVIARTENTQPLLVAAGLLPLVLHSDFQDSPLTGEHTVAAGHSVGELTAAVVAGVLRPAEAIALAAIRGQAMATACELAPTGMSAVVGGDLTQLLERLAGTPLVAATFNGQGQIVVAGPLDALEQLRAAPPAGTSIQPLAVAGAFHTAAMAPAVEQFAAATRRVDFRDPVGILLSNRDGRPVTDGQDFRDKLIDQLTSPVRWDLCLAELADLPIELAVTLPPARTLTSILRRSRPTLPVIAVNSVKDCAAADQAARLSALGSIDSGPLTLCSDVA